MKATLSVLKADIGSVGGHTLPSPGVLSRVREVAEAAKGVLLFRCLRLPHRGRYRPPLLPPARGAESGHPRAGLEGLPGGHGGGQAGGLYGAAQDLFKDALTSNLHGLGPQVAEMEFEERFYGPAMLPMEELEYTGIAERLRELKGEFS